MAYNNPYQTYGNPYQPYYPTALPQQPVQQMQQPQQMYSTRPVTSREEALGAQVDFFGAGTLMPDLAHGIVYLKRFNQSTGASDLYEFRLAQPEAQPEQPADNGLNDLKEAVQRLQEDVEKLKASKAKVVKKNDDE